MNAHVSYTYPELEEAMQWLAEAKGRLLDFGSGSGAILLRSLALGAEHGLGIELVEEGVALARRWAKANGLERRTSFQQGSIERLQELDAQSKDGAVLFNILDNLLPEDARCVLHEIARILKPGARLLIKLNQDRSREYFDSERFEEMSPDFYRADTGLYLWSLSDSMLSELIEEDFDLLRQRQVKLSDSGHYHRLFYLRRRS